MSKKVEMRFTTAKRRGRDLAEAKRKAKRPRAFRRNEYRRRVQMVKVLQVPDQINPAYLKRRFALVPLNQTSAIC